MRVLQNFLSNIGIWMKIGLAIFAIVLLCLGMFPGYDASKHSLTLLVALIAFIIVREAHYSKELVKLESEFAKLIRAEVFTGNVANDSFFTKLRTLLKPDCEICVTTFSDFVKETSISGNAVHEYFDELRRHINEYPNFTVRRVAYVRQKEKAEWIENEMKKTCNSKGNYYLRILTKDLRDLPVMNLVIVDTQHVMLFGRHETDAYPPYIYINNKIIADAIYKLFEEWWRVSVPVRQNKFEEKKFRTIVDFINSPCMVAHERAKADLEAKLTEQISDVNTES